MSSRSCPRRVSGPARGQSEVDADVVGEGDVVLKGARHPCLEVQEDIDFISNDHEMRKGTSAIPTSYRIRVLRV